MNENTLKDEISAAAAIMGRKGGSVRSEAKSAAAGERGKIKTPAKSAAARENGKKGGRPPAGISKRNIHVKEKHNSTKKVPGTHLTGWYLSYILPSGKSIEKFYQAASHSLKEAKHLFFKTTVEPRQHE